jgi:hypothetical protein
MAGWRRWAATNVGGARHLPDTVGTALRGRIGFAYRARIVEGKRVAWSTFHARQEFADYRGIGNEQNPDRDITSGNGSGSMGRPACAQHMMPWLYEAIGRLTESGIRLAVRVLGRRVHKADAPWLQSPCGPKGWIGEQLYERVAEREHLEIGRGGADVGLIPDFDRLASPEFDPSRVRPEVRHFYEHTAQYHVEVWSEAAFMTRPFLWFLVTFVSRRMDQLNFPVSSLEVSRGMVSEVLQLVDRATQKVVYTGWLRKLVRTGRVIYVGFYSLGQPAQATGPCVKVTFPLPLGSSTVFLRPEVQPDGSFKLISSGSRFGDPGFYRMVETDAEHWKVRYIRTLKEMFHVWVDEAGTLRTDHTVRFLGMAVLRLHYKLTPAAG